MRRLLVIIGVLAFAAPGVAGAFVRGPGDGTLVVENAQGEVTLTVRGGIIGRFDEGTLEVTDPVPGDGAGPVVRGYQQKHELGPKRAQYSSQGEVRFRLIGGLYRVKISGIGIDISAVGRGTVILDASGFGDQPGRFSINGGPFQPMPDSATKYTLGPAPTASLPSK